MLTQITTVVFSPTGQTRTLVEQLGKTLGESVGSTIGGTIESALAGLPVIGGLLNKLLGN